MDVRERGEVVVRGRLTHQRGLVDRIDERGKAAARQRVVRDGQHTYGYARSFICDG